MNIRARVTIGLLFLFGIFLLPGKIYASTIISTDIESNMEWTKEAGPYIINRSITINPGFTLTIGAGTIVKFRTDAGLNVGEGSTLIINGTGSDKVYFTSINDDVGGDTNGDSDASVAYPKDWYGVRLYTSATATISNMVLRYAGIGGAALYNSGALSMTGSIISSSGWNSIGLVSQGGTATIESSELSDQRYGIYVDTGTMKISGSNFHDNSLYALYNGAGEAIDARNNYWASSLGPYHISKNPNGGGQSVSDNIDFDPWCQSGEECGKSQDPEPEKKTPILIIPGVLGTEMWNGSEKLWLDIGRTVSDIGDNFIDPLLFNQDLTPTVHGLNIGEIIKKPSFSFDYSEYLISELNNQGYLESMDLFTFPYDWRYGIDNSTVSLLKLKIEDILHQTGVEKVHIIAHSTGGLLAKKYVMDNLSNHHIGKAVFVGVPNTGAPQAIKNFLQGSSFGDWFLDPREMKKISQNLPVVYDLSPSETYYSRKGSFVEIRDLYPLHVEKRELSFADMNNFLIGDHLLNSRAWDNSKNLHTPRFDDFDMRTAGVDPYIIAGCKRGTLGKIIEIRNHGLLGGSESYNTTYAQPEMVPGDGTVPLESATNLPVDETHRYFALKSDHSTMLSADNIRQTIVNIIAGSSLPTEHITQDFGKCKLNGRAIAIYSPISIDITDQNGNHSGFTPNGVSIENDIPNADYEIMDDHKFVYLPTDDGQMYTILLQGTGEGRFTLTDTIISDNVVIGMNIFEDIPVTPELKGSIDIGSEVLILDTNGDESIDQTLTPSKILNSEEAKDYTPEKVQIPKKEEPTPDPMPIPSNGSHLFPILAAQLPALATPEKGVQSEAEIKEYENSEKRKEEIDVKELPIQFELEKLQVENSDLAALAGKSKIRIGYKVFGFILLGVIIIILLVKKLIKL